MLKHIDTLLNHVEEGRTDPSFVITHRGTLDDAPGFYKDFLQKKDDCITCVMTP